MTNALAVSNLVLWLSVVALAAVVVMLLRQVGVLHERMGPVGALVLPGGPDVGEAAPSFELSAISGERVRIGGRRPAGVAQLLFFVSPTCPVCKSLLPVVRSLAAEHHRSLELVLASDGEAAAQQHMLAGAKLQAHPLVLSREVGLAYRVAKLPHAVLIGDDGMIAAKGLVNSREHLDSLLEAHARGVGSLQAYLKAVPLEPAA